MMKLSKKADYGLIALKHLAMHRREESCSAGDIADIYKMSTPLMAKVLQKLAKGGLVAARHGSSGGYTLARDASMITAGCDTSHRGAAVHYFVRNFARGLRRDDHLLDTRAVEASER